MQVGGGSWKDSPRLSHVRYKPCFQIVGNRHDPARGCLGLGRAHGDEPGREVDVTPRQTFDCFRTNSSKRRDAQNGNKLGTRRVEQLVKLLEQKETLQNRVAKIDAQLAAYEGGEAAKAAKGKPGRKPGPQAQAKPAKAKRAKRGAVKAAIIDLVKGAGKPGITIKDVAGKLGLGYNRVFNWFYATGKTIKEIKKAGPGKYAWTGAK